MCALKGRRFQDTGDIKKKKITTALKTTPQKKDTDRKAKFPLYLTKHHTIKTYGGSGGIAPRILDLGTRWK
jgi:hypothetical protein